MLQQRILDAVDRLSRTQGWQQTTMTHVARAAGVSRQSVYNEFRSRDALVRAYVQREIDSLITAAEAAVRAHADDARAALQIAFGEFLKLASNDTVVRTAVSGSDHGELGVLITSLGRQIAMDRLGTLIVEVWPQVSRADAELVAETVARLAISHALLPVGDPADAAATVTRLLGPFVDELLTAPVAGSAVRPPR